MSGPPAGSADTLLFVDQIENGWAHLLLGEEAFDVPARLLPDGAKEGSWLRWSFSASPPPPDAGAAIRRKLQQSDDGGDIKL
ncbi:MAG TPA: DUF3006 domain-containing protein [Polyangia bacterium]|jgi:hypothetical protein|nr:DUF3006 domain-containing protein [Polyangia bacterium]